MDGLHPNAKYRLVALARLVGMQLAVMINNQHYQHVRNVSFDTVGTGLLGKMVDIVAVTWNRFDGNFIHF